MFVNMMKIIGVAILSLSLVLYGLSQYEKRKERKISIELLIDIFSRYFSELRINKKSLSDVIKNYNSESEYIKECKKLLLNHSLYDSTVVKNSLFSDLYLDNEDEIIVKSFFEKSGKSSYVNELHLCEKVLSALEIRLDNARDCYKKYGPLSIKLSVICAVGIAVILL